MSHSHATNRSILSVIMSAVGLRRREPTERTSLFGMGGSFGKARIRHCDTWEVGETLPHHVVSRSNFNSMAQRRREAAWINQPSGGRNASHDRSRR